MCIYSVRKQSVSRDFVPCYVEVLHEIPFSGAQDCLLHARNIPFAVIASDLLMALFAFHKFIGTVARQSPYARRIGGKFIST